MMRLVVPLFVLAVAAAGLLSLSLPPLAAHAAGVETEVVATTVDDDIAKHMSTINRTMRRLKRGLADAANNAKSLEAVAKLQSEFLAVKVLEPSKVAKLEAAEKKKQLVAYRKMNIKVLEHLLAIEVALLDSNMDAAKKSFEALHALEDKGHEQFSD